MKVEDGVIRGEKYPRHNTDCKPLTPSDAIVLEFSENARKQAVADLRFPKRAKVGFSTLYCSLRNSSSLSKIFRCGV